MLSKIRKLVSNSTIAFFIVFFAFSPVFSIANAQTTSADPCPAGSSGDTVSVDPMGGTSGSSATPCTTISSAGGSTTISTPVSNATEITPCGKEDSASIIDIPYAICYAGFWTMKTVINVLGGITFMAVRLFDLGVNTFILEISKLFGDTTSADSGIYFAWKAVRDIANILGFFGAIYAGLMYIIGRTDNLKKIFVNLMMFAILTNFSYPISKFFIDVSNVVSLYVYGSLSGYTFSQNTATEGKLLNNYGLGTKLMEEMGISAFVVEEQKINKDAIYNNLSTWTISFLLIIYLAFCVFVFLEAAFFVIARGLMLIIYVIFSPFMFIGGLAPFLTKFHDEWRKRFVGQLIVGPLLMILIWVAFQILRATSIILQSSSITEAGSTSSNTVLIAQSLSLIFSGLALHFAIKMTKEYSYEAGSLVSGIMGGVGFLAGAAVTGGTSMAMRGTVGRAGAAIAESSWVKEGKDSKNFAKRLMWRGVGNTGNAMTKANGRFAGAAFTNSLNKSLGTNAAVVDGKSYRDVADSARDKYINENRQSLRQTGLSDDMTKVRTNQQREAVIKMHKEAKEKLKDNNKTENKTEETKKVEEVKVETPKTEVGATIPEKKTIEVENKGEINKDTIAYKAGNAVGQTAQSLREKLKATKQNAIASKTEENKEGKPPVDMTDVH